MIRLEMKIYNMISTWKAVEIWVLSSVKINKYEYFTGKDILPSNQQQIIEQPKFTYSPLEKNVWKQLKIKEKDKFRFSKI